MSVPPRDVIVIEACVLSLASNVKQPYYLQKAKDWLQNFGTLTLSAIHTSEDICSDNNEKGNRFVLFAKSANQWLGIRRRFPLACYDQVGIVDLSKNIDLSFIRSF